MGTRAPTSAPLEMTTSGTTTAVLLVNRSATRDGLANTATDVSTHTHTNHLLNILNIGEGSKDNRGRVEVRLEE